MKKLTCLAGAAAIVLGAGCASKPRASPAAEPAPSPASTGVRPDPSAAPDPGPPSAPAPAPGPAPAPPVAAEPPEAPAPAASGGLHEVFPGVRVDKEAKVVEFDGIVPIDAHDADAPLVYLELVACTPDTREHEALVMTRAEAAHVHAALLLIGLRPGAPGSWTWDGKELHGVAPTGPELDVRLVTKDANGNEVIATPQSWIVSTRDHKRFDADGRGAWLFAGSVTRVRQGREVYEAQGAGTLIGLTTFGSETIAWRDVISPEAAVEDPQWIADKDVVPKVGSPVIVRIRAK
jgi:hypothetical protein